MLNNIEFYPTPPDLAARLVGLLPELGADAWILEPSAGSGSFLPALAQKYPTGQIMAIDPNFAAPPDLPASITWDRLRLEDLAECTGDFDLATGNPPFSLAEAHLRILFEIVKTGGHIGFLLRSGFLASQGRRPLFQAYPPKHVYLFSERPSFVWTHTCKECKHSWALPPGDSAGYCRQCSCGLVTTSKTDKYDYCFILWEVGAMPTTTLSWI